MRAGQWIGVSLALGSILCGCQAFLVFARDADPAATGSDASGSADGAIDDSADGSPFDGSRDPSPRACLADAGACIVQEVGGVANGPLSSSGGVIYFGSDGGLRRRNLVGAPNETVLAPSAPTALHVVDGRAYFATAGGTIESVSDDGVGGPTVLASAQGVTALHVVDSTLYFLDASGLRSVPATGGEPVQLSSVVGAAHLGVDGNSGFFASRGTGHRLMTAPLTGGPASVLFEDAQVVDYDGVGAASGRVFFFARDKRDEAEAGPNFFGVFQCPATGCDGAPTRLGEGYGLSGLAADAAFVYFVSFDDGTVNRVAVGGEGVATLVDTSDAPTEIAVDDDYVYWAGRPGPIRRVARCCTP